MRADKKNRHTRLCELIESTIEEALAADEECFFEGYHWAIRPLTDWADMLGVSVDAITDLIKEPGRVPGGGVGLSVAELTGRALTK